MERFFPLGKSLFHPGHLLAELPVAERRDRLHPQLLNLSVSRGGVFKEAALKVGRCIFFGVVLGEYWDFMMNYNFYPQCELLSNILFDGRIDGYFFIFKSAWVSMFIFYFI